MYSRKFQPGISSLVNSTASLIVSTIYTTATAIQSVLSTLTPLALLFTLSIVLSSAGTAEDKKISTVTTSARTWVDREFNKFTLFYWLVTFS